MDVFDKVLKEHSWRFPKGYPDVSNPQDMDKLFNIVNGYLQEVKLSYNDLKKPYPANHELYGKYNDRGERFLEKILNKEKIELNSGGEVQIDIENSKEGINYLKNQDYSKLSGRNKYFVDINGEEYNLAAFKKTKEFGSGSGSGGGSLKTSIQESSQCVVNAISFNVKKSLIDESDLTLDNIKEGYGYSKVTESLEDITAFILNEKDWYDTLIGTANLLFKEYNSSNYQHHRGSDFINSLYNSFTQAKKQEGLSLMSDKWNPSDIWLVKNDILDTQFPTKLEELNGLLTNLYSDGSLIGISLKKTGKNPKLSRHNIDSEDRVGYTYDGFESKPTNNGAFLIYNDGKISFRTFNYATNFAGEIQGKKASHGKIGHGPINDVLKQNNLETLPSSKSVRENIENKTQEFYQEYYNIYNKIVESLNPEQFNEYMREKELNHLVSKFLAIMLINIIEDSPPETQNEVTSDLIRYASSLTKSSSVFIKIS